MILAIDQGTTGTTCLVVDERLRAVGRGYREIRQSFPAPGLVEHDPEEIWASVEQTAADALGAAGIRATDLAAIGITNQRETTVVWERATTRPVHPAIVWQDRRTAERCASLPVELVRGRTGLVPDPYFSATKLEWILERTAVPQAELAFGTIDAWLVWKLTGGEAHVTDVTNASRTMLLDLGSGRWDDELLALFGADRAVLPTVVASSGVVGEASLLGARVPVAGIAGDQQAALFGQGCFAPGEAKATYGTGTFVLVALGEDPGEPVDGLLTTAAAVEPGAAARYAAEGSVLVGGAALQWLRDGLGVIESAAESERRGNERGLDGRRPLRARARRARVAAVAARRTRPRLGADARDDGARISSAPRSRRWHTRSRTCSTPFPPRSRCCAPTAAQARTASSCSSRPTSSAARSRSPRTRTRPRSARRRWPGSQSAHGRDPTRSRR